MKCQSHFSCVSSEVTQEFDRTTREAERTCPWAHVSAQFIALLTSRASLTEFLSLVIVSEQDFAFQTAEKSRKISHPIMFIISPQRMHVTFRYAYANQFVLFLSCEGLVLWTNKMTMKYTCIARYICCGAVSVRLSVTLVYCVEITELDHYHQLALDCSPWTLVYGHQTWTYNFRGFRHREC